MQTSRGLAHHTPIKRTCGGASRETLLWLQTPVPEVLAWAIMVFGVAWMGRDSLGHEWITSWQIRISFDLFAIAAIGLVMLISHLARGSWQRIHIVTMTAIAGDQVSALLVDAQRQTTPDHLWLAIGIAAAVVIGIRMVRLARLMRLAPASVS